MLHSNARIYGFLLILSYNVVKEFYYSNINLVESFDTLCIIAVLDLVCKMKFPGTYHLLSECIC